MKSPVDMRTNALGAFLQAVDQKAAKREVEASRREVGVARRRRVRARKASAEAAGKVTETPVEIRAVDLSTVRADGTVVGGGEDEGHSGRGGGGGDEGGEDEEIDLPIGTAIVGGVNALGERAAAAVRYEMEFNSPEGVPQGERTLHPFNRRRPRREAERVLSSGTPVARRLEPRVEIENHGFSPASTSSVVSVEVAVAGGGGT